MDMMLHSNIILAVYIVSFLIGLPANLLALYAFSVKIHSKPQPTDILLLNLTVSDLLFLLILPMKMHEAASNMVWTLPSALCSITAFIFFSTIYTSSLLLMAISVVRYVGVVFPIYYLQVRQPLYAVVVSAVIWLVSMGHCSITFVIENHPYFAANSSSQDQDHGRHCYEDFREDQLKVLLPVRLEIFLLLCLVPLLVCTYCYLHSICILSRRTGIAQAQRRKAMGMALGTLAVFLVCVIPYNVSHVVGYLQGHSPYWRYYTLLLSALNTCIDPIIFYFSSSAFGCTNPKSVFRKYHLRPTSSTNLGTISSQNVPEF